MQRPHDERTEATFHEFWAHYLLHHRAPGTRALHFVGSAVCLIGLAASVVWQSPWPVIAALVVGYLCAFAGHWWVEGNRPLTFQHPIRAGLCNWRLFGVECAAMVGLGGGFDRALEDALGEAPRVMAWMSDVGGQ